MAINYGQGDANEPSRGYQLYITSLVMILAASLFVAMRLSTRIANKQFGSDDYMIAIALASSVVMAAAVNLGVFSINSLIRFYGKAQGHILADMKSVAVVNGYGKRSTDLAPKEKNAALKVLVLHSPNFLQTSSRVHEDFDFVSLPSSIRISPLPTHIPGRDRVD
ncbi:hypothetical protein GX48_03757 [Paracoccidioides brasiliensis]|nr:hypothetical protein GX48_03757 [Paracoccidioides brasiliensis]